MLPFGETLERERNSPSLIFPWLSKTRNGMGFLRISFVYGEVKVTSVAVVLDDGFSRPLTFYMSRSGQFGTKSGLTV